MLCHCSSFQIPQLSGCKSPSVNPCRAPCASWAAAPALQCHCMLGWASVRLQEGPPAAMAAGVEALQRPLGHPAPGIERQTSAFTLQRQFSLSYHLNDLQPECTQHVGMAAQLASSTNTRSCKRIALIAADSHALTHRRKKSSLQLTPAAVHCTWYL